MKRPKRLGTLLSTKRVVVARQGGVCHCGCGKKVEAVKHMKTTRFDHQPALFQRLVNEAGTDYIPPQRDPDFIRASCLEFDSAKTNGTKATTAGSDANINAKQRARDKGPKPKRAWASRPLTGRSAWPPKGSRPMRKK